MSPQNYTSTFETVFCFYYQVTITFW